jgi:tetraacyldisaccharide 4'-kinase
MRPPLPIRILLWPFSILYGIYVRLRAWAYASGLKKQKRLSGKVISVGNLTVGGTGKTPMVIWLANRFLAEGKRVAILTRGYAGSSGTSDEVELMRAMLGDSVAFGIGPDRFASGGRLEAEAAVDVFLLDDGYQHLSLARDVNVLLVDASRPLRGEMLLPAGRLREPKSASARADLVVLTRTGDQPPVKRAIQEFPRIPIFPAVTQLKGYRPLTTPRGENPAFSPLPPQPVFAFCGIGNPEAFFADVKRWGNFLAGCATFRDHHSYSEKDVKELEEKAKRASAKSILTTSKDLMNLKRVCFSALPAYSCEIELQPGNEAEFLAAIRAKLAQRSEAER